MESSLRSGNFPALAVIDGQINNDFSNNRRGDTRNKDSAPNYSKQHAVSFIKPPVEPAIAASQPDSTQLDYAHSLAYTATIERVHHVAPARQGLRPGQK